jgi:UDP-glucose 4-epimerase
MLITGGAGFVGSYLCEKYVKEGHDVICLDNFMNGNVDNIRILFGNRRFKLIEGDIRDEELMDRLCHGMDVIFNLAAQIHVDRSYHEPRLTYDINVTGTQNVLEAARAHDVGRVIHASTSEVYGTALYAPIDEDHPLNAPHLYGASKIAADRMCNAYMQTYGMNIGLMRPFNIFGPRQKDTGYGGVISIFLRRIMNDEPPIIFGNGKQTRDYTYIDDAVKAYDMVLKCKEKVMEPVNFGTGTEVTINYIADRLLKLCGKKKLKPVHVEPRISEVQRLIANAEKAKNIYGWTAKVDFDTGLEKFVKWYRGNSR